jgi:thiamine biosynthesis lipoprotein
MWGKRNHYFDPRTRKSPEGIRATWVYAESAALADGLSTALFFVPPESLMEFSFEYCILNDTMQRKNSAGFAAEFFDEEKED